MEAKKYRPLNITPVEFMRPPTEPLEDRLIGACLDLERKINKELKGLGGKIFHPRLRIGAEVELNLFSDKFDPEKHNAIIQDDNPNYDKSHRENINRLLKRLSTRAMFNNRLWPQDPVTWKKEYNVFTEIRTSTGDVKNYIKSMKWLRNYLQKSTSERHISPVVHSEHIHMSFASKLRGINLMNNLEAQGAVRMGVMDAYRRMFALIRLPEEIAVKNDFGSYTRIMNGTEVRQNGSTYGKLMPRFDPLRIEGRKNSSEYAFDPYLNLLVHLVGVYRGLQYASDKSKINSDYNHGRNPAYYSKHEGSFGTNIYSNYHDAAYAFLKDKVVIDLVGQDLVTDIYDTIVNYTDISEGRGNLSQVRDDREKKVGDKKPSTRRRGFSL
ncbi:MAG TPA: hypothetical protein VF189_03475 [Patescibacteria group bacterium]